jgi:hypothetical protein
MANRSILCTAVVLTFLVTIPVTLAQSQSFDPVHAASSSGFRTDRLTPKQRRIWGEIERIVQATDNTGRPRYPMLHSLWQRIHSSGHTAFIEMSERWVTTGVGGKTTFKDIGADGSRRAVVIWLHLWTIDNATADPRAQRSDGLIPCYGLGKNERYAEVLGHELVHAVLMLENPEYARLSTEYDSASKELSVRRKTANKEEIQRRYQQLQSLSDKVERPAEAAELEIWRELIDGQWRGSRRDAAVTNTRMPLPVNLSFANGNRGRT